MIDGAGHMMKLDPKGLEAAREQPGTNHEAIIRAYIDAIMPVRVSGLVERLRQYEGRSWETTHCYNGVRDEAATSIENLSIGLATVWRNKLEAEDALASERAAHAETKRVLARAQEFERQHDYCCCGSRMDNHSIGSGHSPVSQYEYDFTQAIDRAEAAEARLAEVVKALGRLGTFEAFTTEGWGFDHPEVTARVDYARRILSALEPHPRATNTVDAHETANVSDNPEGQQEPVAWEWAAFEEGERRGAWTPCGYGDEAGWKALVKRNPAKYRVETRPLYTRPSGQAVTEVITHAMSDYASAATSTSWNKACFAFEADAILCALSRAGFRIIGPDDVDPVTLEKAADAAEEQAEWVPLKAGDMRSAIRALATKEEGDE